MGDRHTHDDDAVTLDEGTARLLLLEATPKGKRLLELFARRQILYFRDLQREFDTDQHGLNRILGRLTELVARRRPQAAGFYIYLPELKAWAVGHASRQHLRKAFRMQPQPSLLDRLPAARRRARAARKTAS